MFGWLWGSSGESTLTLVPDEEGRKLHGFRSGEPIVLKCLKGETVGTVMDRFNTYRGPDQQILMLFVGDVILDYSTPIHAPLQATVRRAG
jgi:hypothetical protein